MEGIVIRSTGSWYRVRRDDSSIWECRIVGKYRLNDMILTNPVAVGDRVRFFAEEEAARKGLIREIRDRRNYVARQSPRQKHQLHLLASNVDQAMVIATIREPQLKPGFIDRFILMTEPQDIPLLIVFNKADLLNGDDLELYEQMHTVYTGLGYRVHLVSAKDGRGIAACHAALSGKTTLIAGQSGVGKSTLINALQPGLALRTGDLSDFSGKGKHTTTFAEMLPFDEGGFLIDTPGIKTLSFNNLEPMQVAHNFKEMFEWSQQCRFGSACTHRSEPQCAVISAVESGDISPWRYANYLYILDEIEVQNYWERHTNM